MMNIAPLDNYNNLAQIKLQEFTHSSDQEKTGKEILQFVKLHHELLDKEVQNFIKSYFKKDEDKVFDKPVVSNRLEEKNKFKKIVDEKIVSYYQFFSDLKKGISNHIDSAQKKERFPHNKSLLIKTVNAEQFLKKLDYFSFRPMYLESDALRTLDLAEIRYDIDETLRQQAKTNLSNQNSSPSAQNFDDNFTLSDKISNVRQHVLGDEKEVKSENNKPKIS